MEENQTPNAEAVAEVATEEITSKVTLCMDSAQAKLVLLAFASNQIKKAEDAKIKKLHKQFCKEKTVEVMKQELNIAINQLSPDKLVDFIEACNAPAKAAGRPKKK